MFSISQKDIKQKRVGETNFNYFNYEMKIVDYRSATDIDIYFPEFDCTVTNKEYFRFKKGEIHSPYDPMTLGIGYLGEGEYETKVNGKLTFEYQTWFGMLRRCYDPKSLEKYPTYRECSVCEEWHNFQTFAQWLNENYYEVPNETMCLDKDILIKDNKEYSPDTCIFTPKIINSLFTKRQNDRGSLPVGVKRVPSGKYVARCDKCMGDKNRYIGTYNTPQEAFQAYKEVKEHHIKEIADKYIDYIPNALYQAMYDYTVEIDD